MCQMCRQQFHSKRMPWFTQQLMFLEALWSSFWDSLWLSDFSAAVLLTTNLLCTSGNSGYSQFGYAKQEYAAYSWIYFHQKLESPGRQVPWVSHCSKTQLVIRSESSCPSGSHLLCQTAWKFTFMFYWTLEISDKNLRVIYFCIYLFVSRWISFISHLRQPKAVLSQLIFCSIGDRLEISAISSFRKWKCIIFGSNERSGLQLHCDLKIFENHFCGRACESAHCLCWHAQNELADVYSKPSNA